MKRLLVMTLIGTLSLTACEETDFLAYKDAAQEDDDFDSREITLPEPGKDITEAELCSLIGEDIDCLEGLRNNTDVCGGLLWGRWAEGIFEGAYVTWETTELDTASCHGRSMGWMNGQHAQYENPEYEGGFFLGDWDDEARELGGGVQGEYLPNPHMRQGSFYGAYDSINAKQGGEVWGLYRGQPHEDIGAVFVGFFQDVDVTTSGQTTVDDDR